MFTTVNKQPAMRKWHAGYTIDQTILIVAIIAILVTIVIATVGWDLISRTGGAKLAAQLRQMEDANGQFFSQHMRWPHQSLGGAITSTQTLQALTAHQTITANANFQEVMCGGAACGTQVRNLLPGLRWSGDVAYHDFGSGTADDLITMELVTPPSDTRLGVNSYLAIAMYRASKAEVLEADKKMDGTESSTVGRLIYRPASGSTNPCTNGGAAISADDQLVNLCYFANLIQ